MGQSAVAGHVGGVRRSRSATADCVSQHDRQHDGRGRSPQRHLRATTITVRGIRRRGIDALPYPRVAPGGDARYEIDEELSLDDVAPMIAKPFSPGNAFPADEVARERIQFDKALIGSCTNGSYDDLLQAALVLHQARRKGVTKAARPLVVFPGRAALARAIERPDPRLDGESIAEVFRSAGGEIRQSWCGPCFGQGPDALRAGERAITSFNRNWQNRMGVGGEGYLASPAIVAASALAGYMAPPSALGLTWDAEVYGIQPSGIPSCIPAGTTMRILLSVGTCLLLGLATVAAQQQQQAQPQQQQAQPPQEQKQDEPIPGSDFRTGVDLVAIDVSVVDRHGRPIEDLRAAEFAVKIDGEVRRVVSAELIKIDVEAAKQTGR